MRKGHAGIPLFAGRDVDAFRKIFASLDEIEKRRLKEVRRENERVKRILNHSK